MANETLYGSFLCISDIPLEKRLRFAGHCACWKDQYVSDLVLWQPMAIFLRGGHARKTFLYRLLNDTGMNNIVELHRSIFDRDDWNLIARAAVGVV